MCFSGRLKHPTDFQRLRNILQAVTAWRLRGILQIGTPNASKLSWPVRYHYDIQETLDQDLRFRGRPGESGSRFYQRPVGDLSAERQEELEARATKRPLSEEGFDLFAPSRLGYVALRVEWVEELRWPSFRRTVLQSRAPR
jgi:hypothetical protein